MEFFQKTLKRVLFNIIFDVGTIYFCLIVLGFVKYSDKFEKLVDFNILFGLYVVLVLIFSFIYDKYEIRRKYGYYKMLNKYLYSWLLTTIIILSIILFFDLNYYRWDYVLVILISLFGFEVALVSLRFSFRYAKFIDDKNQLKHSFIINESIRQEEAMEEIAEEELAEIKTNEPNLLRDLIPLTAIQNKDILKLVERNSSSKEKLHLFVNTVNRHIFFPYRNHSLDLVLNALRVNHLQYINKFLEIINIKLKRGGKLIICVETLDQRRRRHNVKFPPWIRPLVYFFEFVIHRLWPRLPYLRKFYFWIWKKNSKRISYAETLGRLYSCGFEYVEELYADGLTWLVFRKKDRPLLSFDVTYSPIVKLRRIGKGGKVINVYKMRTMHPYSEFLQDFIFKTNKLAEGGKFQDDFRISSFGRIIRKMWIDEFPMIFNLIKRDLKLVGVRPLSKHYFSLYPLEIQKKRTKYKPGLIPPFYADLPKTFEEIVASESKYLDEYEKAPFFTDLKYFWKALWNILVKRARSK